ncbi:MAG: bacillopeptidase-like protein, partial [Firmicutes bacterium]|nr:bacillopeptidase-like protein [Bacillota bacterium]
TSAADVGPHASVTLNFTLRPFIGTPGEIAYDDGHAENAWGYFAAGNGWGVRMSPTPGQPVVITGARFFLWDTSWPTPGGNSFQAAIYRANPDGTPGNLLAGPITINNAVRGDWNNVDLSAYGITVTGDFYVVYIQSQPNPNMPGMATDTSTPDTHRNFQLISGVWSPWTQGGNFMIRAQVSYAAGAPVIATPADGSFTNQPQAHVTGASALGTTVNLSQNGTEVAHVAAGAGGSWAADITLTEGPNRLTATATVPGSGIGSGTTDPSAPTTVTLDTVPPAVAITAPGDGSVQRSRVIQVTGTAADSNLASVRVNGQAATVDGSGRFLLELIGQEGANTLTVVAADRARNQTQVVRTVRIDTVAPAVAGMQPATDQNLAFGGHVTVAFDSEPGLALAAFQVVVDPAGGTAGRGRPTDMTLEPGETALQEVTPGHYQAEWTVPSGYAATRAYVRFRAVDQAGNETRATAPGVLRFTNNRPPTAVIVGPTTGRVGQTLRFDGSRSSDPDGRIVSYAWNFGDGGTSSGSVVLHRFTRAGTFQVTLTVTDNQGATATATTTVTIRR